MSDLISRGDAIKAVLASNLSACTVFGRSEEGMATAKELIQVIKNLPSVQPEPLTLRVNNELTKEEYDKLMQDIKDASIVLLPYEQPDRKTREWLHDLLQAAIDDGIITEAQAVRIMDKEPG